MYMLSITVTNDRFLILTAHQRRTKCYSTAKLVFVGFRPTKSSQTGQRRSLCQVGLVQISFLLTARHRVPPRGLAGEH